MYKPTTKASTGPTATTSSSSRNLRPSSSSGLVTTGLRPPSPKTDAPTPSSRRAAGSPALKVPPSTRSGSRKSPSIFDSTSHERSGLRIKPEELNDQVLLSLSRNERFDSIKDEQQSSFERSVIEDTVLHEIVEKQKQSLYQNNNNNNSNNNSSSNTSSMLAAANAMANMRMASSNIYGGGNNNNNNNNNTMAMAMISGHNKGDHLYQAPYEREVSVLTDELTSMSTSRAAECLSDDGTGGSDRTHPMIYHATTTPVLSESNPAEVARSLTDDQLRRYLEIFALEHESRNRLRGSSVTPEMMGEGRRLGVRTSRSGSESLSRPSSGVRGALTSSGPLPGSPLACNGAIGPFAAAALRGSPLRTEDMEDAELLSAFAGHSPAAAMSRNLSRNSNSGVHQPLEKMAMATSRTGPPPPTLLSCVTPPSPVDFSSNSQSSSRPPSRLSGLVHLQALLPNLGEQQAAPVARRAPRRSAAGAAAAAANSSNSSVPVSSTGGGSGGSGSSMMSRGVEDLDVEMMSRGRELLLSPFSAFDDLSVGSQSMASSRSSKTRPRPVDIRNSPPTVRSKHSDGNSGRGGHGRGAVAVTAVKPVAVAAASGSHSKTLTAGGGGISSSSSGKMKK